MRRARTESIYNCNEQIGPKFRAQVVFGSREDVANIPTTE